MTRLAPPKLHDALQARLEELDAAGLRRLTPRPDDGSALSFCSNDYLGLARRRLPPTDPVGAGAARLISGEHEAHGRLERALADWLRVEACLVFSSGYAANLGALSALALPEDLIVSDELNHASIIDGARLSRARVSVVPHNDAAAIANTLEQNTRGRAWVVVESYYSMDADGPDLAELARVCSVFGASLYVDEAHALGVLGPDGRGRCAEAGVVPDVLVGTLGKAFGSQGAFVAGAQVLRDWLWNRARSFVFSTGLSPYAAEAARAGLEESRRRPELRERVLRWGDVIREGLRDRTSLSVRGFGPIVPILIGDSERAVALARALGERGVRVPAIRPPTVPAGTSRLRLTVSAAHQEADLEVLLQALASLAS